MRDMDANGVARSREAGIKEVRVGLVVQLLHAPAEYDIPSIRMLDSYTIAEYKAWHNYKVAKCQKSRQLSTADSLLVRQKWKTTINCHCWILWVHLNFGFYVS